MASPSKEEKVLKIILENSPLKEWRFKEVMSEADVSRLVADKWLKKYVHERLLKKIDEKGSFPYYTAGKNNPKYYSKKKVYMLKRLEESGLIAELISEKTAKTIILFGSVAKGDWYKDSDIDLFVFGKLPKFNKKLYEKKIGRTIEVHQFKNKKEIKEVKTGLINNIVNGYLLKGKIQDIIEI